MFTNRLLAARVAGQFGLVTRAQALGGGISPKAIECHLATGRWVVVHPGVYLTTPGREGWDVRAMAALLWAGDGAALHLQSAGFSWALMRVEPPIVQVVVPAERRVRDTGGVAVSRSRHIPARTDSYAWPHRTAVTETVFDLAIGHPVDRGVTLAARALDLSLCTTADLAASLRARARFPNRALLLETLTDVHAGSESAAEVRYVRDVERAHGLPSGRRQVPVGDGKRRDVEYDEFSLVVEIDGRLGHARWADRQRDGRRDRGAAATGRLTVRVFWPDLVPSPCALAAEVGVILMTRGWTDQARPCRRPTCSLRGTSVPSWGA